MAATQRLIEMLEPVITAMGYELVGLEYHPSSKRGLLRIYIDAPDGIGVDDCARVSHQVSGVLDVEDPLPGEYNLEVSSPGLERPIFKASDYDRFAGEQVRVRVHGRLEGRRKFRGTLRGLRGDSVVIEEGDEEVLVPLDAIERANLELEPDGR
ncbi:ribosome maturation factor RimP [Arhodomonas sp. AD133]|uniref:ribosome maturation factor RimP n=1 Tax=Arhodomonas sp. AD133 TaxID=3415009 RepID=UPI003EB912F3